MNTTRMNFPCMRTALIAVFVAAPAVAAELSVEEAWDLSNEATEGFSYVELDGVVEDQTVLEILDVSIDQVGGVEVEIDAGTLAFSLSDMDPPLELDADEAADVADDPVLNGLSDLDLSCGENSGDCIVFSPRDGGDDQTFVEMSLWGDDDTADDMEETLTDFQTPGEDGQ